MWGEGNWEWLLIGTMFLLGGDGKVLQLDSNDNSIYEHTKKPLNCTFLTGKVYGMRIIAQLKNCF